MSRIPSDERENTLRTIELRSPAWIPASIELAGAAWFRHGLSLGEIVRRYPSYFPYDEPSLVPTEPTDQFHQAYRALRDDWGCVWRNSTPGILGQVVGHPLADWSALETFCPPDPAEQHNWRSVRDRVGADRRAGRLVRGGTSLTQGGFIFDRLQFLRGMENLLLDFALEPPELATLIEMVTEYNVKEVKLWLDIGVDLMAFHGDIGSQCGLMFSPRTFRKLLRPAYSEVFQACRRAGSHVYYSSDGWMLGLVNDLIECGVTLHDPEVSTNTAEGIARTYQGRLCAKVQLDAQMLPHWAPSDIQRHVRDVVETISRPEGGLMVFCYVGQDVPLRNIAALCASFEEFCG